MAVEIERKFLVASNKWRQQVTRSERMMQGYLAENERCSVRVRLEGERARLNIKSAGIDIERLEFEYPVPVSDAEEILNKLCGSRHVQKMRHYIDLENHVFEVDEFEGDNAGLIIAEIELKSRDESFNRPDWLGREVSGDPRYLNNNLAREPFNLWR
ncbi:MAG: CYTH domain-containing protein [marine bacterium B5-7]|nr:MAG: CYTH domain-containing protein [marine bacterium B5-7]